jgi:hypothetical protein
MCLKREKHFHKQNLKNNPSSFGLQRLNKKSKNIFKWYFINFKIFLYEFKCYKLKCMALEMGFKQFH